MVNSLSGPIAPSDDWLHEFAIRLIESRGNASRAARYMASDLLGIAGYYRTPGSQWTNGSKLRKAIRGTPEFRARIDESLGQRGRLSERRPASLTEQTHQDSRSRIPGERVVSRGPDWCVREWMRGTPRNLSTRNNTAATQAGNPQQIAGPVAEPHQPRIHRAVTLEVTTMPR